MLAKSIVSLVLLAGLVLAQEEALGPNGQPRPEPYSFSYAADSSGKFRSFLTNRNSRTLIAVTDAVI